jgi:hypothetical protein
MAQPEAPGYHSAYGTPPPQPPGPPNRPVGLIVGAIIAVAVLIMVAGSVIAAVYVSNRSDDTLAADPPSSSATTGSSTDGTSADSTAPTSGRGVIGTAVRQGDLLITVTAAPRCNVKSIGSGYSTQETEKGQFCLIDLKFENTGTKAIKPRQYDTELIDEAGGETTIDYSSYKANPDNELALFENVYPAKTVTGVVVFDIPADQKPATIKLNPVGEAFTDSIEISLK